MHTTRRLTLGQRAVLACAVAALACAILLGVSDFPVFASPHESTASRIGVDAFGVGTLGVLQPTADLRIKPVCLTGADGAVTYTFRVSNDGPDAVTFEVATTTYARPAGSERDLPTNGSTEHTLSYGEQVDIMATCETVHACSGAVAWIERMVGVDPNSSNDLAYVHAQR